MASTAIPTKVRTVEARRAQPKPLTAERVFELAMSALASLKLTVALFALGIFVVWVGTLAQTTADIWQVMDEYFRAWVMWINGLVFFPRSFFPGLYQNAGLVSLLGSITVPFPGGMTVGAAMAVNLLAAHLWRFTVQARGARLVGGLGLIGVGIVITVLVILGGHNSAGFQATPILSLSAIEACFYAALGVMWVGLVASLIQWSRSTPAKSSRQRGFLWGVGSVLAVAPVVVFVIARQDVFVGGERILWQLMQASFAGLVLLAGCAVVFNKRAGMVLLHGGVGLLMFGELFVSQYAVEAQMTIGEGETANYVQDIRTTELAIIDPSAKETDDVVVIPRELLEANLAKNEKLLKDGEKPVFISDEKLPFNVAVVEYHKNHNVREAKPDDKNPATKGRGLKEFAVPASAAKGTDTDSSVDMAAAYVKLADKKGNDLGTYMVSQLASLQKDPNRFAEKVTVDDKTFNVFLRFRRDYKPYSMSLIDVRKDDYLGTNTPMNYSSDVRLVDKSNGTDREVKIWMNHPLRYAGETFYQSSYHRDPATGEELTTLSVVKNTGWMIPYVACMIVVIGMCAHFLIALVRFLERSGADRAAEGVVPLYPVGSKLGRGPRGRAAAPALKQVGFSERFGLPLLVAGLFAVIVYSLARPPHSELGKMDLVAFGELPVVDSGRVKPFDTLARNSLRTLSNRESVKDEDGKRVSATAWMLDVMTGSRRAFTHRAIHIDNPEIRDVFGLEPRKGHRYAVEELTDKYADFEKQVEAARKLSEEEYSPYQRQLLQLDQRLRTFAVLQRGFAPPELPPLPTPEEFEKDRAAAQKQLQLFMLAMSKVRQMIAMGSPPRPIPNNAASSDDDAKAEPWQTYPEAWLEAFITARVAGQDPNPAVLAFDGILSAYRKGNVREFNAAVAKYQAHLESHPPQDWNETKVGFEAYFNHFSPFFVGIWLYVAAFVLAMLGWLFQWKPLNRAAFTLVLLTFALHTFALVARIYISGRPPVTNLYSSAVFIGWAAVLAGLVLEGMYRMGIGNIVSSVIGFATLLIAFFLAAGGDTIAVLQAVLDTQFWLATHVVCISLGYMATFLAGALGLFYVLFGLTTPRVDATMRKDLARMIYGTVCFAILFSFFGTVLGGLWADDSWGRFWGWDPKENGALIIVLWNALVLHARWGKMVGDRGLAVLAIGGNIVTAWSWFGVNELGVGLHSYGFTKGVQLALGLFVLSQLVLIGVGLIPTRLWWSFQAEPGVAKE